MIKKLKFHQILPGELRDKINEIINDIELNKKECSCEMNYPMDFENKHDNPKNAIDEDIHYQEYIERAENFCLCPETFNCSFNPELKLYKAYYPMKDVDKKIELFQVAIDATIQQKEKELTISRETCNALNEKIRQLEAEIKNKRDLHLALLKTLGVTE